MKYLVAALGAACVLASASPALAKPREDIQLRLPTAGANLASPKEARELRAEAKRQIERACNPGDRLEADLSPDFQCRREMIASVDRALRQQATLD